MLLWFKKLVQETLSQMNGSEFKEDITAEKKSIEKTWNEKYKIRNDLFYRHHRKQNLYSFELLKENPCISQNILPNYNGKETPEVKEIMMKNNFMKKNVTW